MVKLPPEDLEDRPQNVFSHYRVNQNSYAPPIRLMELEEFSELAAVYMNINVVPISRETYVEYRQTAMNRIRQLFNMEFKLRCDICGTAHYQDEITAPER